MSPDTFTSADLHAAVDAALRTQRERYVAHLEQLADQHHQELLEFIRRGCPYPRGSQTPDFRADLAAFQVECETRQARAEALFEAASMVRWRIDAETDNPLTNNP